MKKSLFSQRFFTTLLVIAINCLLTSVSLAQTRTVVAPPIARCLTEIEQQMGGPEWVPKNDLQFRFFTTVYPSAKVLGQMPEMKTKVAQSAGPVNAFLAANGFRVHLQPLQPGEFAVGAVMKVKLVWQVPGIAATLGDSAQYPAVYMREGFRVHSWRGQPVLQPLTSSGDQVFMVMLDRSTIPNDDVDLYQLGMRLLKEKSVLGGYQKARFPMVQVDQEINLQWLVGLKLNTPSRIFTLSQAVQQNKFAMDEKGATVESAAAVAGSRSLSLDKELVINREFLLVIARNGSPILVGWIEKDSWKRPRQ